VLSSQTGRDIWVRWAQARPDRCGQLALTPFVTSVPLAFSALSPAAAASIFICFFLEAVGPSPHLRGYVSRSITTLFTFTHRKPNLAACHHMPSVPLTASQGEHAACCYYTLYDSQHCRMRQNRQKKPSLTVPACCQVFPTQSPCENSTPSHVKWART